MMTAMKMMTCCSLSLLPTRSREALWVLRGCEREGEALCEREALASARLCTVVLFEREAHDEAQKL